MRGRLLPRTSENAYLPRTSVNKGIKKDRASRGPGPLGDYWKSLSCSDVTPTSFADSGYVGELQVR
jgi:hypothetical protein